MWPREGGDLWGLLDTRVSGENGGEKVPTDHEPEDEGEVCREVRGERPDQLAAVVGELDRKQSEEHLLIGLPSARFCLSMSAGAEALRSHIDELLLAFHPLITCLLSSE